MEPVEDASKEIITYLQELKKGLGEDWIRRWILTCMEQAEVNQDVADRKTEQDNALRAIRSAAEAMSKALQTAHALTPKQSRGAGMPEEDNPNLPLPLMDLARFEGEIESLTRLGVQREPVVLYQTAGTRESIIQNPPKDKAGAGGRHKIAAFTMFMHVSAREMLEHLGIKPTTGSSQNPVRYQTANVARLGALLCAAAGRPLRRGESTKAARLACNRAEAFAYVGIVDPGPPPKTGD